MTDPRHGLPSASIIPRIAACPGSWQLAKGITPIRTPEMIEWAESGDRIHLWLQAPGFIDLDPAELDIAHKCDLARVKLMADVFRDGPPTATYIEQRLWLNSPNPPKRKICSGQQDFAAHDHETLLVIDYKTSWGDTPESEGNLQIRTNIVIMDRHLQSKGIHIQQAYGGIVQPLLGQPQLVRYDRNELDASFHQILDIIDRANLPDAPFVPGDHCRFCPALLICKAAAAEQDKLDAIKIQKVKRSWTLAGGLAPADIPWLLNSWKVAKHRGELVEAAAKLALRQDPASVPGWELSEPARMRNINSVIGTFAALSAAGLIDEATFIKECVSLNLGATEAAIKTTQPNGFRQRSPRHLRRHLRRIHPTHL
jgi:hypothetical protein